MIICVVCTHCGCSHKHVLIASGETTLERTDIYQSLNKNTFSKLVVYDTKCNDGQNTHRQLCEKRNGQNRNLCSNEAQLFSAA